MTCFEENDISKNAWGGTEITKRKLAEVVDQELQKDFQVVPSRVRDLKEDKIRIYWAHDLPGDPECEFFKDSNKLDKFHKIVFSSHWQYQQFRNVYNLPYDRKSTVIQTWIEPPETDSVRWSKKSTDVLNLFYASTPHRGLDILIPVYEKLLEDTSDVHLHVHSSFKIYGWEEQDKQFEPIYERIKSLPHATYHGKTDRQELLEKFNSYHILAYPCTWQETSCRVLMEAMSAGCMCVHPGYAGLVDTAGGLTWQYNGDMTDKNTHAGIFYGELKSAINMLRTADPSGIENRLLFAKQYADLRFNLEAVKIQWENLFRALQQEFPTEESRKFPKAQFVYRV